MSSLIDERNQLRGDYVVDRALVYKEVHVYCARLTVLERTSIYDEYQNESLGRHAMLRRTEMERETSASSYDGQRYIQYLLKLNSKKKNNLKISRES